MSGPLSTACVRFGVITDIHFPADPAARPAAAARVRACVERCNAERVDFVVQLGDLIERGFETYPAALDLLGGLTCDVVHVLGNHDFDVGDQLLSEVPGRLGLTARYYAFSRGGVRFVVLDGNEVSLHAHPPGSMPHRMAQAMLGFLLDRGAAEAEIWNGAISRDQAAWLNRELDRADEADEPAVVFNHFPTWPSSRHTLWNGAEVLDTLTRHRTVVLYVNGHAHAPAEADHRDIRFVTAPALAAPENRTPLTLIELHGADIDVRFLSLHGEGGLAE